MDPLTLAWIASLAAAALFFSGGLVSGRALAFAARATSDEAADGAPDEPAAPAPALPSLSAGASFEQTLSEYLAALGGDGAVLADTSGLPLATAGDGADAELLAALSSQATSLAHRAEQLMGTTATCVAVRLFDGRILTMRRIALSQESYVVALVGAAQPSDELFVQVADQLVRVLHDDRFKSPEPQPNSKGGTRGDQE